MEVIKMKIILASIPHFTGDLTIKKDRKQKNNIAIPE